MTNARRRVGGGTGEGVCVLVASAAVAARGPASDGAQTADPPDAAAAPAAGDRDLEAAVRAALRRTGYPLRAVVVTAAAGRVTLAGRVTSFHLKRVAQAVTLSFPAVRAVCNGLEVAAGAGA